MSRSWWANIETQCLYNESFASLWLLLIPKEASNSFPGNWVISGILIWKFQSYFNAFVTQSDVCCIN